jgi:hypothetical protein
MAEVINLRTARKQAKRGAAGRRAEENRARFGRTKSEKDLERAHAEKMRRDVDAHRIEREDGQ